MNSFFKTISKICFAVYLIILQSAAMSSTLHYSQENQKSNRFLEQGKLEEAEAALYRARLEAPYDARINYNLGRILYRRRRYAEAAKEFEKAAEMTHDDNLKSSALHNLGNTCFRSGIFHEAITAYTKSLELKDDAMTRYNLDQARKKLDEMQRQQQQQQEQPQQNQNSENKTNDTQDQNSDSDSGSSDSDRHDEKKPQGQDKQNGKTGDGQNDAEKKRQENSSPEDSGSESQSGSDEQGQKDSKPQQENSAQKSTENGEQPENEDETKAQSAGDADEQQNDENPPERAGNREEMSVPQDQQPEADLPKPSEKAKAMEGQSINPYMIERVLKQMEEREKQLQLRYRNERRDDLEDDPFFMNGDQLREFFERRHRPKKQNQNTPDW